MMLYENCYIKVIFDDSCDIFFFFVLTGVQIRASLKYSRIRGLLRLSYVVALFIHIPKYILCEGNVINLWLWGRYFFFFFPDLRESLMEIIQLTF